MLPFDLELENEQNLDMKRRAGQGIPVESKNKAPAQENGVWRASELSTWRPVEGARELPQEGGHRTQGAPPGVSRARKQTLFWSQRQP